MGEGRILAKSCFDPLRRINKNRDTNCKKWSYLIQLLSCNEQGKVPHEPKKMKILTNVLTSWKKKRRTIQLDFLQNLVWNAILFVFVHYKTSQDSFKLWFANTIATKILRFWQSPQLHWDCSCSTAIALGLQLRQPQLHWGYNCGSISHIWFSHNLNAVWSQIQFKSIIWIVKSRLIYPAN